MVWIFLISMPITTQKSNSINFPLAFCKAPFLDKNQSTEKNYGGIGVVIGHEITHAFDSNGADYDENGDMHNWWTKADSKKLLTRE
ncbi:MAG: M13-type metalloendopeptidase [Streptococcus sp.]